MKNFLVKKVMPHLLFAFIFLAPLGANAQTPSGMASWLSHVLNWHTPLLSHVSNLLETRRDNVENTGVERNQLLNWRKGTISITSSPTVFDTDASSSPVLISYSLFKEKKASIIVELLSAENSLKASRSKLYTFIDATALQDNDMSELNTSLAQVDTDIIDADSAIQTFENYEPATSTSDLVDLKIPQSYFDVAISMIQTARNSLKSAISLTSSSI
jgi:hypothetical protein